MHNKKCISGFCFGSKITFLLIFYSTKNSEEALGRSKLRLQLGVLTPHFVIPLDFHSIRFLQNTYYRPIAHGRYMKIIYL